MLTVFVIIIIMATNHKYFKKFEWMQYADYWEIMFCCSFFIDLFLLPFELSLIL